jgi:hypothetical protein
MQQVVDSQPANRLNFCHAPQFPTKHYESERNTLHYTTLHNATLHTMRPPSSNHTNLLHRASGSHIYHNHCQLARPLGAALIDQPTSPWLAPPTESFIFLRRSQSLQQAGVPIRPFPGQKLLCDINEPLVKPLGRYRPHLYV